MERKKENERTRERQRQETRERQRGREITVCERIAWGKSERQRKQQIGYIKERDRDKRERNGDRE